jgi:hypothetical protein
MLPPCDQQDAGNEESNSLSFQAQREASSSLPFPSPLEVSQTSSGSTSTWSLFLYTGNLWTTVSHQLRPQEMKLDIAYRH